MSLVEYPDVEMMMMDLADTLASEINGSLLTHDRASFCVPGGTTPGPIFDTLSAVHLDWARVTVLPSDERWVPPEDPRSNERLIRSRLLVGHAAEAQFAPLYRPGTPEDAMPEVAESLAGLLPISVLVLGMGADMHTASLFPGSPDLPAALDPHAPPVMAMDVPGASERRVTLTAPVLRAALSTHIVITGAEKREAFENARKLPEEQAPVKAVLAAATVHWADH